MLDVHLVPHTHWDREWYHPLGRFRQRLVALIDELLDDPPPHGESFLLDGQAVVLEDYLAVRPERRDELAALLRDGMLEAGPWYVLADELIPSGEALVRNLLLGRRVLSASGAESPPVLYCPDSFGHPAALPELALGFALPLVIAWRGFGGERWPRGDTFTWVAPGGGTVTLFHLPRSGYEYGSALPTDPAAAAERWARVREELGSRSATGVVLLQNGADHHARQPHHREAVAALARAAEPDDSVRASTLRRFATALVGGASNPDAPPPRVEGELRDSYGYAWTLQGTLATRARQKRANAAAERLLLREAEPWNALVRLRGGASRLPLLVAAWRALLQCHPHDTLCGCSVDDVATAMDARLADATAQGAGIAADAVLDLVGHDPATARERRGDWRPVVLVRNRAARARGGVALLELRQFLADVPVGSGSAPPEIPRADPPLPRVDGVPRLQALSRQRAHDRVESPRHYPDDDLVVVTHAVAWVEPVPALGIAALAQREAEASSAPVAHASTPRRTPSAIPNPVRVVRGALHNGRLRVELSPGGVVALEDRESGRVIRSLLLIEDRVDAGDLYTPAVREEASAPRFAGARVLHRGPLRGTLRTRWRLHPTAGGAGRRTIDTLDIDLVLDADAPFLRLEIAGENRRDDHRLRVGLRTGLAHPDVVADAAFALVRRTPLSLSAREAAMEHAPPTAPLHRYVSLFHGDSGATVYGDGLAEYEATGEGDVFVTLLRAVGELSRNDLPERPGHAGWPAPTPLAQSRGPFAASLALMLHGGPTDAVVQRIEEAADDVLLPLAGESLRSALALPAPVSGVALDGEGLAFSSLKESEDGAWIVARCVNHLDHDVPGAWRFGARLREARLARLDETPLHPLGIEHDTVAFNAPPRSVVTILVR